ncbi:MAG: sensor histidine kinase, partial [Robiginitalea sp.]
LLYSFAGIAGINAFLMRYHANLTTAYQVTAITAFFSILGISFFSGGIGSPFVFMFVFLVLGGYMIRPLFGHIYLTGSLLAIILLLVHEGRPLFPSDNTIPEASRGLFAFLGILFFMALMGGIIGRNLLDRLHDLYRGNEALEQQVEEKEMLLKEVHHRVKNNLQTVSSLLRMQGRSIEDTQTLNQIRSSQNRVVCMAMVHEMLYRREDLACIEYSTYVQQLGDYLVKSIKGTESNIRLSIDIPEIELGIDTAIPLGLLINEAVTNALKYGFEGTDEGEITISLEKEDKHEFVLRIGDNGVGYPETIDYQTSKSLGLKLIHNLSRQLKGSVIRDLSKRGTNYIIRFQEVSQDPFHSIA